MPSLLDSTKLLLHFNGEDGATTTIDSSNEPHEIFFTGSGGVAELDTAEKVFGSSSLYADWFAWLYAFPSEDWDLSIGDLTIDFWFKYVDWFGGAHQLIGTNNQNADTEWAIYTENSGKISVGRRGYSELTAGVGNIVLDTWYHIAVTRKDGTTYIFVNGVLKNSGTGDYFSTASGKNLMIMGQDAGNYNCYGWIEEVRILKGIAEWTEDFDVPTAEHTIGSLRGKEITLRADIGFVVNEKLSSIYNIYKKVPQDLNFLFNNGFLVAQDLAFIFDGKQLVDADLQFLHDNGFLVGSQKDFSYILSAYVAQDLPLYYFIEGTVGKNLEIDYHLKTDLVGRNLEVLHSILEEFIQVSKNLQFVYSQINVGRSLGFEYNLNSQLVSKDLNISNDLKNFIRRNLQIPYGIRWSTRRNIRTLNSLYASVVQYLELTNNVFANVLHDLVLSYTINPSEEVASIITNILTLVLNEYKLGLTINSTKSIHLNSLDKIAHHVGDKNVRIR